MWMPWSLIYLGEIQFKCAFWLTEVYNIKNERTDEISILQNEKIIFFLQPTLKTSILWVWFDDQERDSHYN